MAKKGKFSGYPKTRWVGPRNMELLEDFWYEDPKGKKWTTPTGAAINGATIPKALWTLVGPPFVGKYRRASVVHDYAVGEGSAPDVSYRERRKADKMFYYACLTGGCRKKLARKLYVGVSIGSWASRLSFQGTTLVRSKKSAKPNSASILKKFNDITQNPDKDIEQMDIDELEALMDKELEFIK